MTVTRERGCCDPREQATDQAQGSYTTGSNFQVNWMG